MSDSEYQTNFDRHRRSSILKPAKVSDNRAPLQDLGSSDDTTTTSSSLYKKRVSFAGIKIKEFSTHAQTKVVPQTPAYDDFLSSMSDSSHHNTNSDGSNLNYSPMVPGGLGGAPISKYDDDKENEMILPTSSSIITHDNQQFIQHSYHQPFDLTTSQYNNTEYEDNDDDGENENEIDQSINIMTKKSSLGFLESTKLSHCNTIMTTFNISGIQNLEDTTSSVPTNILMQNNDDDDDDSFNRMIAVEIEKTSKENVFHRKSIGKIIINKENDENNYQLDNIYQKEQEQSINNSKQTINYIYKESNENTSIKNNNKSMNISREIETNPKKSINILSQENEIYSIRKSMNISQGIETNPRKSFGLSTKEIENDSNDSMEFTEYIPSHGNINVSPEEPLDNVSHIVQSNLNESEMEMTTAIPRKSFALQQFIKPINEIGNITKNQSYDNLDELEMEITDVFPRKSIGPRKSTIYNQNEMDMSEILEENTEIIDENIKRIKKSIPRNVSENLDDSEMEITNVFPRKPFGPRKSTVYNQNEMDMTEIQEENNQDLSIKSTTRKSFGPRKSFSQKTTYENVNNSEMEITNAYPRNVFVQEETKNVSDDEKFNRENSYMKISKKSFGINKNLDESSMEITQAFKPTVDINEDEIPINNENVRFENQFNISDMDITEEPAINIIPTKNNTECYEQIKIKYRKSMSIQNFTNTKDMEEQSEIHSPRVTQNDFNPKIFESNQRYPIEQKSFSGFENSRISIFSRKSAPMSMVNSDYESCCPIDLSQTSSKSSPSKEISKSLNNSIEEPSLTNQITNQENISMSLSENSKTVAALGSPKSLHMTMDMSLQGMSQDIRSSNMDLSGVTPIEQTQMSIHQSNIHSPNNKYAEFTESSELNSNESESDNNQSDIQKNINDINSLSNLPIPVAHSTNLNVTMDTYNIAQENSIDNFNKQQSKNISQKMNKSININQKESTNMSISINVEQIIITPIEIKTDKNINTNLNYIQSDTIHSTNEMLIDSNILKTQIPLNQEKSIEKSYVENQSNESYSMNLSTNNINTIESYKENIDSLLDQSVNDISINQNTLKDKTNSKLSIELQEDKIINEKLINQGTISNQLITSNDSGQISMGSDHIFEKSKISVDNQQSNLNNSSSTLVNINQSLNYINKLDENNTKSIESNNTNGDISIDNAINIDNEDKSNLIKEENSILSKENINSSREKSLLSHDKESDTKNINESIDIFETSTKNNIANNMSISEDNYANSCATHENLEDIESSLIPLSQDVPTLSQEIPTLSQELPILSQDMSIQYTDTINFSNIQTEEIISPNKINANDNLHLHKEIKGNNSRKRPSDNYKNHEEVELNLSNNQIFIPNPKKRSKNYENQETTSNDEYKQKVNNEKQVEFITNEDGDVLKDINNANHVEINENKLNKTNDNLDNNNRILSEFIVKTDENLNKSNENVHIEEVSNKTNNISTSQYIDSVQSSLNISTYVHPNSTLTESIIHNMTDVDIPLLGSARKLQLKTNNGGLTNQQKSLQFCSTPKNNKHIPLEYLPNSNSKDLVFMKFLESIDKRKEKNNENGNIGINDNASIINSVIKNKHVFINPTQAPFKNHVKKLNLNNIKPNNDEENEENSNDNNDSDNKNLNTENEKNNEDIQLNEQNINNTSKINIEKDDLNFESREKFIENLETIENNKRTKRDLNISENTDMNSSNYIPEKLQKHILESNENIMETKENTTENIKDTIESNNTKLNNSNKKSKDFNKTHDELIENISHEFKIKTYINSGIKNYLTNTLEEITDDISLINITQTEEFEQLNNIEKEFEHLNNKEKFEEEFKNEKFERSFMKDLNNINQQSKKDYENLNKLKDKIKNNSINLKQICLNISNVNISIEKSSIDIGIHDSTNENLTETNENEKSGDEKIINKNKETFNMKNISETNDTQEIVQKKNNVNTNNEMSDKPKEITNENQELVNKPLVEIADLDIEMKSNVNEFKKKRKSRLSITHKFIDDNKPNNVIIKGRKTLRIEPKVSILKTNNVIKEENSDYSEKCILEKSKSGPQEWNIKRLESNLWEFSFFNDLITLKIEFNQPKYKSGKRKSVKDICFETNNTKLTELRSLCFQLLHNKYSKSDLESKCISSDDIIPLLDHISPFMIYLKQFAQCIRLCQLLYQFKLDGNIAILNFTSYEQLEFSKVSIDLSDIDFITPASITVEKIFGNIRDRSGVFWLTQHLIGQDLGRIYTGLESWGNFHHSRTTDIRNQFPFLSVRENPNFMKIFIENVNSKVLINKHMEIN